VEKAAWNDQIRANINRFGRHIYTVVGKSSPRFSYTIGLREKTGFELVLAGGVNLPSSIVAQLLNLVAVELEAGTDPTVSVEPHGKFHLEPVDPSWVNQLLLGALDYYQGAEIRALQVVPEPDRLTIDIPKMSEPYRPNAHPVWKWLDAPWPFSVAPDCATTTNLDALLGYAVTELMRWGEDEFEMFSGSGPDTPREHLYQVPLCLLVAFDPSLERALSLPIGTGLFREYQADAAGPWMPWNTAS